MLNALRAKSTCETLKHRAVVGEPLVIPDLLESCSELVKRGQKGASDVDRLLKGLKAVYLGKR